MKFQALRSVTAAAVASTMLFGAQQAISQAGPFGAIGGSWAGTGTIKKSNGGSERIRCRAVYEPNAANLQLRIRCASDSYNIDLNSSMTFQGGTLSGQWQEATRQLSGSISGQSTGGGAHIQAVATGPVTSNITVTTRGGHQSVAMFFPGTEVPEVLMSLEKR